MERVEQVIRESAGLWSDTARNTVLNENFEKHRLELRLILDRLPGRGSLLDLGGGVGFNLLCLRQLRPDAELVLVDRLLEYTEENRMGTASAALDLLRTNHIEVCQIDFWPTWESGFPDARFHVTTCFDVFEHLPGHPIQQLGELARITRPGGWVVFGAPNAVSLMKRVKLLLGRHPYMDFKEWTGDTYFQHFREYTAQEYAELAERAGLVVERVLFSAAVTKSRALNRYHRRKHAVFSSTALALYGLLAAETLVPALRHTVYVLATKN